MASAAVTAVTSVAALAMLGGLALQPGAITDQWIDKVNKQGYAWTSTVSGLESYPGAPTDANKSHRAVQRAKPLPGMRALAGGCPQAGDADHLVRPSRSRRG
ncbi:hypothetical protein RGF97_14405 [Streptomyces roseicoloratus]|uniref:Uncharacterized protein n=1 Tax=Streptomyces roseicoloratus TaxID=2508722 RepID=A0ABY9RY33_9ACTN|nr:hypothetical protein [Streptomyces roseicoloratus]WMX45810.1 hypothetical protein RGF97_14405 [Streptomyces roseicoloratus]